jgi:hypothetical protein
MSTWEKRILFHPGYDRRDEIDGKHGAHNMVISFVLIGPNGAVSWDLNTGWMKRPLVGGYVPGQVQARRDKPGADARLWDYSPSAGAVASHTHERINDYDIGGSKCPYIGGNCYCNVIYLVGDDVLAALFESGHKGVWKVLKRIYREWTAPEST